MSLLPPLTYSFTITSQMCDNGTQIFAFSNVNYLRIFKLWKFDIFPYTSIVLGAIPSTNVPTKDIQQYNGVSSQDTWWEGQVG